MKRFVVTTFILSGVVLAGGCATKKYVRQTTAPIQSKVDQVADQSNKQGQEIQESRTQIKQVDEKAQSGISAAQERAQTADTRAGEALTRAGDAQKRADEVGEMASKGINDLRQTVSNLDDYKMATEVTVPFSFNKYSLNTQAKQELDQLAANLGKFKRYFIAVEGYTDRTGSAAYNDELSRKRADAVMTYLVGKHDIPVYRIHMIGLGQQKPIEEGRTRAARAKNRRVEVKLFTADQGANAQQTTPSRTMSQVQPER